MTPPGFNELMFLAVFCKFFHVRLNILNVLFDKMFLMKTLFRNILLNTERRLYDEVQMKLQVLVKPNTCNNTCFARQSRQKINKNFFSKLPQQ